MKHPDSKHRHFLVDRFGRRPYLALFGASMTLAFAAGCGGEEWEDGSADEEGLAEESIVTNCTAPPKLSNPRTVTVSTSGGNYSFGYNEDALIRFPSKVVTDPVTITGGRNIHIIGGEMSLRSGKHAIAFNYPGTGQIFVEGMKINVNNRCDVFALRNHRNVQTNFTFQNIYAYGPGYNTVGDCHGDFIQFQANGGGGFNLKVENFTGATGGQGFFLPHRTSGKTQVTMRNVEALNTPNPYKGGLSLYYFVNNQVAADKKPYPVQLSNVYADWIKPDRQIMPWKDRGGIHVDANTVAFQSWTQISGVIKKGRPGFVSPSQVGINYKRANFCK